LSRGVAKKITDLGGEVDILPSSEFEASSDQSCGTGFDFLADFDLRDGNIAADPEAGKNKAGSGTKIGTEDFFGNRKKLQREEKRCNRERPIEQILGALSHRTLPEAKIKRKEKPLGERIGEAETRLERAVNFFMTREGHPAVEMDARSSRLSRAYKCQEACEKNSSSDWIVAFQL
jgi:hypothetical protein